MSSSEAQNAMRWGMIADDLTGACDTAVAFAAEGFATRVVLDWGPEADSEAALTAVSTDSRHLAPDEAAAKVAETCRRMRERGIAVLYKKIDSVLRGNIEAEVAAVMDAGGFGSAVLTPAFPEMGRTVRGGALRVFGKRVNRPDLETMFLSRPEITVKDAETDEDLRAIVEAALASRPVPLFVGSGGLAGALAKELARRSGMESGGMAVPTSVLPVWFVIGSRHAATAVQLDSMEAAGLMDEEGPAVLLRVPWERFDEQALQPVVDALERGMVGALVVSGGDTARLLCGALQAKAIRLGGEVLPGIPWGRLEGGVADGMTIVTKSGGFGAPDALVRVVDSLHTKENG